MGTPSGPNGFRYITVALGEESADNVIPGRKLPLKSIGSFRRGRLRNKIFMDVRPYGIFPLFIHYEMALEAGEIEPKDKKEG